jgi:branched-chain amino acid transport system substrate-binding protein
MKLDKERTLIAAFALLLVLNVAATAALLNSDGRTEVTAMQASSGSDVTAPPAGDSAVPGETATLEPGTEGFSPGSSTTTSVRAGAAAGSANRAVTTASGPAAAAAKAAAAKAAAAAARSGSGPSGSAPAAGSAAAPSANERIGVGAGTIKVGALSAGNFPIPYGDFMFGPAAYFRSINEQGGVNGLKIEYVSRDANFDAARGTTECRRLIEQDKIFAMVGMTPIFGAGGCYKMLNDAGVPNIGPDGVDVEAFRFPNAFNLSIDVYNAGRGGAWWAHKKGARSCSVVYVAGNQNMTDYKDGFVAQFQQMGGKIASIEAEPIDQPDFSATVLRIRSKNPDCIFLGHAPDAALRILQAMQRQGNYAVPYLVFGYENYDERVTKFASQYPAQVKEAYMPVQMYIPEQAGQYPVVSEYASMMKKYYPNATLSIWQEMAWLSAKVFVDALRKAGPNPTRSSVIAALESLDAFDTGMFPDRIPKKATGTRHLPRRSMVLLKYDASGSRWVPQPDPASSEFWVPKLPRQ